MAGVTYCVSMALAGPSSAGSSEDNIRVRVVIVGTKTRAILRFVAIN
jgi:hypothetical protein